MTKILKLGLGEWKFCRNKCGAMEREDELQWREGRSAFSLTYGGWKATGNETVKPPGWRKRSQNWSRIYLADAREPLAGGEAADIDFDRLTAAVQPPSCLTARMPGPQDRRKSVYLKMCCGSNVWERQWQIKNTSANKFRKWLLPLTPTYSLLLCTGVKPSLSTYENSGNTNKVFEKKQGVEEIWSRAQ